MEYNSAIEKAWNPTICNNMDRPRGYYAKMKCQTKTNTVHYHLHVESKKKKEWIQQNMNRFTDIKNKLVEKEEGRAS